MKDVYKYVITPNKVIAISTYCGRTVRGVAKCHPNDVFDEEIGKQLAAARCGKKIAEKRYKRARDKYDWICEIVKAVNKEFHNTNDYLLNSYLKYKEACKLEEEINDKIYS